MKPRPADLDRAMLRSQSEEPCRADDLLVTACYKGDLRADLCRRERLIDVFGPLSACLRLNDVETAPGRGIARREPQSFLVLARERLKPHDAAHESRAAPPFPGARQYTGPVPIYEYACMECESHFEELVRSSAHAVTCPESGAAKVVK